MRRDTIASIPYRRWVPLDACPFCREMFDSAEASVCPSCGIELVPIAKLPPSPTLRHEVIPWDEDLGPEHDKLPWSYWRRGRGPACLLAVAGILLFMLPWVKVTLPFTGELSGWDLSRRVGWSWAALAAWVVLGPTVASRRTVAQLRGARVAASFLAAVPAVTASILLAFPPRGGIIPVHLELTWPLYATLVASIAAIVVGVKLGGRADVIVATRGSSENNLLH
jgi:hypothetical protein